jgi:hypothetical protein
MVMVTVDVDEFDVVEELSTSLLVKELRNRAKVGDKVANRALAGDVLMIERAIEHLRAGRVREAMEVLTLDTDTTSFDVSAAWEDARKGNHPFLAVRGRAR